ncbi:MAG: glycosyltransferase family 39 protein [Candidatus Acidiferrales bacterium]
MSELMGPLGGGAENETNITRDTNPPQGRIHSAAFRLMLVLLLAYCVVGAAILVFGSPRLLHNPWENSYCESPQTYAAIYAAQTGKLYIPMSQAPYTPQAYAPLYYAINACVARAVHLDIDRFILFARLMTYIAFLLCGGMVFLICRAASLPRLHSILAALMMLGQPDFIGWNISPRPDMLFILAMLISLYCAVRWEDRLWYGYGLCGVFAAIAFLIKQPGIAVAFAIFAVLVLSKEFKKAAVLTLGAILPVVLTFSILYWRHDPFFQQMAFAGKSRWSFSDAANFLFLHCLVAFWLIPILIGIIGFSRAVTLDIKAKMIAAFALVNLLVGLSGMPQLGGYVNYLFPGLVGCALLLPYAMRVIQTRVRLTASIVVVSVALVFATSTAYAYSRGLIGYFYQPPSASVDWLRPFRVLSDVTTMNVHGREPNLLDPFGAHMLELTGNWDPAPVVDNLKRGDYDLIVLTRAGFLQDVPSPRGASALSTENATTIFVPSYRGISYFGPEEVAIINDKYEVLCSTKSSVVLIPRGRAVAAPPEAFSRMFGQPCRSENPGLRANLKLSPSAR